MLVTTGENHMSVQPAPSWHDCGKAHADLKGNSRLLRQNRDGAELSDQAGDAIVSQPYVRVTTGEMGFELVSAAGVRLVAVREPALTVRTLPHHSRILQRGRRRGGETPRDDRCQGRKGA